MTFKKTTFLLGCALLLATAGAANAQGVLYVKNNFVGIGIDTPTNLLHLKRNTGFIVDMVKLENNGSPQFLYLDTSINVGWREGPNPSGDFVINETSNLGVAEMRVTKTGELYVAGTQLNVPDYVFEDDYELRPLHELASYIEANGHLPGVLTAADRKRDGGINITRLPLQTLEKVEELTLYTLQQQEAIDLLIAQNRELMERLERMERAAGN